MNYTEEVMRVIALKKTPTKARDHILASDEYSAIDKKILMDAMIWLHVFKRD